MGLTALFLALLVPTVAGPRATTDLTPTYRFSASGAVRFLCSVDSPVLHKCARRYTPRLAVGTHVLRVVAVDRRGRRSGPATVRIRIDAPPVSPDAVIRVGRKPFSVGYGAGSVWAVNNASGTVSRVDPASGRVIATIPVGPDLWGVAASEAGVWVGSRTGDLARIDPATNGVVARIHVGGEPIAVALGYGAVWAGNGLTDEVWRINPATNSLAATYHVEGTHEFLSAGEGAMWVASEDGYLNRLDPATGAIGPKIFVGADPDYFTVAGSEIWATAYKASDVWRVDATTGASKKAFRVGGGAQGIVSDGSSIWIGFYHDPGLLVRFDMTTGRTLARYRIGAKARGVAIGAGSVWVVSETAGTLSRVIIR